MIFVLPGPDLARAPDPRIRLYCRHKARVQRASATLNGSLSWIAANVPRERKLHRAHYGHYQLSDNCSLNEVRGAVRPARYIAESLMIARGRWTEVQMQIALV